MKTYERDSTLTNSWEFSWIYVSRYHFSIFFILATISRKKTCEKHQWHQLRKKKHLKQNIKVKMLRQHVCNDKPDCSCCPSLILSSTEQARAMPLSGVLRIFFTFIFCAMSTTSFVRECITQRRLPIAELCIIYPHHGMGGGLPRNVLFLRTPTLVTVFCRQL